jgi:hypothetical protein
MPLSNEHLAEQLRSLSTSATKAAKAVERGDLPPMLLAEAVVEAGKLAARLDKLAAKIGAPPKAADGQRCLFDDQDRDAAPARV